MRSLAPLQNSDQEFVVGPLDFFTGGTPRYVFALRRRLAPALIKLRSPGAVRYRYKGRTVNLRLIGARWDSERRSSCSMAPELIECHPILLIAFPIN